MNQEHSRNQINAMNFAKQMKAKYPRLFVANPDFESLVVAAFIAGYSARLTENIDTLKAIGASAEKGDIHAQ